MKEQKMWVWLKILKDIKWQTKIKNVYRSPISNIIIQLKNDRK